MVFEADAWDSTISFAPGIPVALGGTLEFTFAADVNLASQLGRTFHLFNWTGVTPTGAFAVSSPYAWNLSNLYATGQVTLAAIPEPRLRRPARRMLLRPVAAVALTAAAVALAVVWMWPSPTALPPSTAVAVTSAPTTPTPPLAAGAGRTLDLALPPGLAGPLDVRVGPHTFTLTH